MVSDLPKVEYAQNINVVDHIPVLWRLGLLDDQSAAAFLRMTVDGCTYERAVGRHLNTRFSDVYSIHRSLNTNDYLKRSHGDEGQPAMDRFNRAGRISSFITHYTLPMADLWFKTFPELKIIVTLRHPIDICYSWRSRGWVHRWGKDPLGFSPTTAVNGEPVPWFALDFAEEYLLLSPINRIVRCVLALNQMYDDALASLKETQKAQVETVVFERMATEPVGELKRLAAWLGTNLHPEMPVALARERVPRTLNIADRRAKLDEIAIDIKPELLEQLISASGDYETRWGLEALDHRK